MSSRGPAEITGGLFDKQWARRALCIFLMVCVNVCYSLTEKPCLCVWVSATRGMLIIWIFILFPDIQNGPTVFVRKQTGCMAPKGRSGSIYFKLPSGLCGTHKKRKKKTKIKIEKS